MAGAAGGFLTRAFESMLKESSAKKFTSLQSSIQSYLDEIKEEKQLAASASAAEAAPKSEPSSSDEAVDKEKGESDESHASVDTKHTETTVRTNVYCSSFIQCGAHIR